MIKSRYWPFGVRWAFIASLIMVPALVAVAVWLYRPEGPLATKLTFPPLLVAVLLGLLPVVLVILGGIRSVQAAGVTVAFAAVQDVVSTHGVVTARSLIADNLGNPPGSVMDTGSDTIIDSLKNAVGNHSVVADLKEGDEWWDTRLLVLVSGGVRLTFPKAVIFTGATPEQPRCLLGWATPSELLRRLLARDPALNTAYREAQRDWLLWQLGAQAAPAAGRVLPWAPNGNARTNLPAGAPIAVTRGGPEVHGRSRPSSANCFLRRPGRGGRPGHYPASGPGPGAHLGHAYGVGEPSHHIGDRLRPVRPGRRRNRVPHRDRRRVPHRQRPPPGYPVPPRRSRHVQPPDRGT